jgi:lysophospholipase L1-like esterase
MMMRSRVGVAWASLLVVAMGAACSSPTTPTSPPPSIPDAPAISCPASITAPSADGLPVAIIYDAPTILGHVPKVPVACTMASGSNFPPGTTTVTCTAEGLPEPSASCDFDVTVVPPPRVSATRFVAFGDSITEGKVSFGALMLIASPSFSYPFRLQLRLTERYVMQTFDVLDEGVGGERVAGGLDRLPRVLSADIPEVVLLMEGVNNLNDDGATAIPVVVDALRSMIRTARNRGVTVFIGTLLPQRVGGSRAYAPTLIQPANDQIRAMAAGESVVLVDLYQAFAGHETTLLGADGLHPNEAGYDKIAETFFDAIRARLEVAPGIRTAGPRGVITARDER